MPTLREYLYKMFAYIEEIIKREITKEEHDYLTILFDRVTRDRIKNSTKELEALTDKITEYRKLIKELREKKSKVVKPKQKEDSGYWD